MQAPRTLKLLFATNYSESCFRAIRAVAQLADVFQVHLTIAHVSDGGRAACRSLASFFAEADHYESCTRVSLAGAPISALVAYARAGEFDLILAPNSDRIGMPRLLRRSLRAELVRAGEAPVWTTNWNFQAFDFQREYRTIAACIVPSDRSLAHVHLAASFAAQAGAELRLFTVIPPVHEHTMLSQTLLREPLCEAVAVARIEQLLSHWHHVPQVEVARGTPRWELPKLAARSEANLLFVSETLACSGMLMRRMNATVEQAPCPVIVVPNAVRDVTQIGTRAALDSVALDKRLHGEDLPPRLVKREDLFRQGI